MLFWILLGVAALAAAGFGIHAYNNGWGDIGNAIGVFIASFLMACCIGFVVWGVFVLSNWSDAKKVTLNSTTYQLDKDSKFHVKGDDVSFVGVVNSLKEAVNYEADVVQVLSPNPTQVEITVFDIVDERWSPWPLDTQSNVIIK